MTNSVVLGWPSLTCWGGELRIHTRRLSHGYGQGALWGLVYGVIWWVLGPLVLMPLVLGMGLQFSAALTPPMLMSLVGHLVFGLITGLVYAAYVHSRSVGRAQTTA